MVAASRLQGGWVFQEAGVLSGRYLGVQSGRILRVSALRAIPTARGFHPATRFMGRESAYNPRANPKAPTAASERPEGCPRNLV